MNWLELSVEADPEAVESVSELFARYGYNGGVVVEQMLQGPQEEARDWETLTQPEIDPSRPVSVRTYLPNDAEAPSKRQKVEEALWHLGQMRQVSSLRVEERREEDWANAWKAYYGIPAHGQAHRHQAFVARIQAARGRCGARSRPWYGFWHGAAPHDAPLPGCS